ncbi:MAG: glycosyltransferase [Syntrophobacteraceae bacterium]
MCFFHLLFFAPSREPKATTLRKGCSMRILTLCNAYPSAQKPWEGPAIGVQVQGLRNLGLNVHVLHLKRQALGKRVYLGAYPKIRRLFMQGKFDILHVQYGGLQALLGSLAAGRRCVITYRGTDLHGGFAQNHGEKIRYWTGVQCSRLAATQCGACIVVSKNLLSFLESWAKRAAVIPSGVDYHRFFPMDKQIVRKKLGLCEDARYILFCDSGADPVKRRDLAKHCVELVQGFLPKASLLLLSRVAFGDVPLYINAADVLLVTSQKEGSPNIVKEAVACNLPVVAVEAGDIPAMISGLSNCYITQRDPGAISGALLKVLADGRRSEGREKMRYLLDNENICRRVLSVYEDMTRSSRPHCW